ncbi:MAG: amino acid permease, partial [Comamonadaceae bacterium]
FALACAALTWASVRYAGLGALLGLTVLAAGLPLLGWTDRGGRKRREQG